MTKVFSKKEQTPIRKRLRNQMTKSEVVLWKYIKNSQLGFKFRRQCGIGNYVVDFYCPEVQLAVEVDGLTHEDDKIFKQDRIKESYFQSLGLNIKRYTSEQIFKFIRQVVEDLAQTCGNLKKKTNHPLPPPS